MDSTVKKLMKQAPELIKDNQMALLGAVVGYLLSDNEKAKSVILGGIAGKLLGEKKENF